MARYPFDARVRKAFGRAVEEAHRRGQDYVDPAHLFLGLLAARDREIEDVLDLLSVPPRRVERALSDSLPPVSRSSGKPPDLPWTSISKRGLKGALDAARASGGGVMAPVHVFLGLVEILGLVETRHPAATILADLGITGERARRAHRQLRTGEPAASVPGQSGRDGDDRPVWLVEVDPDAEEPLYEQIIAAVEEAVATARLAEGERLPSVRDLAAELGIAPGTVARAYRLLEERGLLVTEGARGTRVARQAGGPRPDDLSETLEGLLRPVAVAAYHMGARAQEVRSALEAAMRGIYGEPGQPPAA